MELEFKDNSIKTNLIHDVNINICEHSQNLELNIGASSFIKVDNDMVIDGILQCPIIFLQFKKSVQLSCRLSAAKTLHIGAQVHLYIVKSESSVCYMEIEGGRSNNNFGQVWETWSLTLFLP